MDREYDPIPMGSKNLSLTKGIVYNGLLSYNNDSAFNHGRKLCHFWFNALRFPVSKVHE